MLTFLLEIGVYSLLDVMYVFISLLGILLTCTLIFTIYRRNIYRNKKLWEESIVLLISTAIFYEEHDEEYKDAIFKNKSLLQKTSFRQYLLNKIILTRKDISGSSIENLKRFYENLELNKDSLKKLKSRKWHIKAKGVQELAVMEQKKYSKKIFRLTNDENEYVRNEAQCALISFRGFPGLRFLNITTHPISEWQQIQLLSKLNGMQPQNFEIIKKWLQSKNEAVIVFALKLASLYNCFDLYENVIQCLSISNAQVKLNALYYLKRNPQDDTAVKIVSDYTFDNKTYRLAIIDALTEIGNEDQLIFLLKRLHDTDNDIKASAARTLSAIHPSGVSFFKTHLFADENPWKSIFLQLENDRAA